MEFLIQFGNLSLIGQISAIFEEIERLNQKFYSKITILSDCYVL